jgi:hypothetical protein
MDSANLMLARSGVCEIVRSLRGLPLAVDVQLRTNRWRGIIALPSTST